jgi:hypothetical protein
MLLRDPATFNDRYPSYGTKTKYQIKSLISIVNMKNTVTIVGNTFTQNSGIKGIIYLDMAHSSTSERAVIVSNTFSYNAGYLDSSVIYVRGRGPTSADVYDVLGSSSSSYCGGYLFQ